MQDDEIDLFELGEKLWDRKWTIIAITAFISVLAVMAAMLLPPTWQAGTRIYTPTAAQMAPLHEIQQEMDIGQTSAGAAFSLYYRYLTAPSTLHAVFESSGLAELIREETGGKHLDAALSSGFKAFQDDLSIERRDEEKEDGGHFVTVTYESGDQAFAAKLINNYLLPTARQRTAAELSSNIKIALNQKISGMSRRVSQIENRFVETNALKTMQIGEALDTAKAGGIRGFPQELPRDIGTNIDSGTMFVLGSDVLAKLVEQHVNELERYKFISRPQENDSDRPMLGEVIPHALMLQRLQSLDVQLDDLQPVVVDEPAMVPASPVKPKKKLIAVLGVVLGGMLGVFVALVQIAIASRKEKQRQTLDEMSSSQMMSREQEMEALRS